MWQSFVRSWIQQQVHQSAAEALRARREGPSAETDQPQLPCDVGVVFALGIESGGLEDLLQEAVTTNACGVKLRQGKLGGRVVVVAEAGLGSKAAAAGTQVLIAGHRPSWLISAGFAGGLDGRLRRGDIVMANALIDRDGRRLAIDLKLDPEKTAASKGLHIGPCVTTDRILYRPDDKRRLGEKSQALAVDMESWAVGDVCRQSKTPFLAVRIISDAVDDELPPDVEALARQTSVAGRFGAVAGAVFRRPSSIKDMLKLREDALVLSDRLARFLAGVIEQLPQSK
ncbi:MAG: hypothetical protein ACREHD_07390 [Pirellulales bacterium]